MPLPHTDLFSMSEGSKYGRVSNFFSLLACMTELKISRVISSFFTKRKGGTCHWNNFENLANLCASFSRKPGQCLKPRESCPEAVPLWGTSAELGLLHSHARVSLGTWPELGTRTQQLQLCWTEQEKDPIEWPWCQGRNPTLQAGPHGCQERKTLLPAEWLF